MSGLQGAAVSSAGYLTSFFDTDTVPAIDLVEEYYAADVENEVVGCLVSATEHFMVCIGM